MLKTTLQFIWQSLSYMILKPVAHPAICMHGKSFPLIADTDTGNEMNPIAGTGVNIGASPGASSSHRAQYIPWNMHKVYVVLCCGYASLLSGFIYFLLHLYECPSASKVDLKDMDNILYGLYNIMMITNTRLPWKNFCICIVKSIY